MSGVLVSSCLFAILFGLFNKCGHFATPNPGPREDPPSLLKSA
jgi:hypothetical protein